MVIISTRGWQTKETDRSTVPDPFLTRKTKSVVPVKGTLEMLTVLSLKLKSIAEPFCRTVISCLLAIFSTMAVTEATQFSTVTVEVEGEIILTPGRLTRVTGVVCTVVVCV